MIYSRSANLHLGICGWSCCPSTRTSSPTRKAKRMAKRDQEPKSLNNHDVGKGRHCCFFCVAWMQCVLRTGATVPDSYDTCQPGSSVYVGAQYTCTHTRTHTNTESAGFIPQLARCAPAPNSPPPPVQRQGHKLGMLLV